MQVQHYITQNGVYSRFLTLNISQHLNKIPSFKFDV